MLYISTNNIAIDSKEVYIPGSIIIGKQSPAIAYTAETCKGGRGNSIVDMPKSLYKIKFNKKSGLFESSKQWVLLANYADKSLVRNEVALN